MLLLLFVMHDIWYCCSASCSTSCNCCCPNKSKGVSQARNSSRRQLFLAAAAAALRGTIVVAWACTQQHTRHKQTTNVPGTSCCLSQRAFLDAPTRWYNKVKVSLTFKVKAKVSLTLSRPQIKTRKRVSLRRAAPRLQAAASKGPTP